MNLVPLSIAEQVLRGRASRRVTTAAVCVGMLAIGVASLARWLDGRSALQLALAREASAPVILLEDELASLRSAAAAIEGTIETQRAVGVSIPASAIVRAVASSLPTGALLELIALDYANVQGSNKRIRRTSRDEPALRELRGEIAGIASNESDVGRIVDQLALLAPVSQVRLESSRSREFRGLNAREFRIQFTVDLERRWKLPELAEGSAVPDSSKETLP